MGARDLPELEFPEKLQCLFEPARYKVAHGGRGSAKSWSFARALLALGAQRKLRILCTREVQKSIKDSVHKLLSDQIEAIGLGWFYVVQNNEIRGANGTEFLFAGLADHTVESIKSYEGVDVVWVEEAHKVSKRSWDILIPTIRKEGSEIWISLNPELESDETYSRFVLDPPGNAVVVQINYSDNPWFPDVLEQERVECLRRDPKGYPQIWEGKCLPAVAGAIYYDEMAAAQEQGRITNVPYDPMLKVHVILDLGWNDAMFVSLVQRGLSDLRVIETFEESHKTLDWYSAELRKRNLNWGTMFLPHDGRHKDFKTGKSSQEIMEAMGWTVAITPSLSVEDGIRTTRMAFPRMYFDKTKSARIVQCAKRYRRSVNQQTNEPGAPLHDEFSHGADNLRYIAINADQMTNETWGGALNYPNLGLA
ncbi:PBSX family phage terminase large subunit [Achromobacter xylosoxidans]|uniref:PBSX family phage terminase large subunit n=1 Tax=Achromobacter aegrifaciens TaxID=1287736 RepID=UPI000D47447B|nr:PBSX family phage terminase large subunit [Achromobacter aegrifaciens]MDQ1759011.1 PBSX family phage terminase large subunit [Achromobacter aegrifaciens]PTN50422.1 PBSX family phage terminase large subunit [Achromobacter xylosoxidans]